MRHEVRGLREEIGDQGGSPGGVGDRRGSNEADADDFRGGVGLDSRREDTEGATAAMFNLYPYY